MKFFYYLVILMSITIQAQNWQEMSKEKFNARLRVHNNDTLSVIREQTTWRENHLKQFWAIYEDQITEWKSKGKTGNEPQKSAEFLYYLDYEKWAKNQVWYNYYLNNRRKMSPYVQTIMGSGRLASGQQIQEHPNNYENCIKSKTVKTCIREAMIAKTHEMLGMNTNRQLNPQQQQEFSHWITQQPWFSEYQKEPIQLTQQELDLTEIEIQQYQQREQQRIQLDAARRAQEAQPNPNNYYNNVRTHDDKPSKKKSKKRSSTKKKLI